MGTFLLWLIYWRSWLDVIARERPGEPPPLAADVIDIERWRRDRASRDDAA